jgi:tRNA (guanine10-N2)-methyltransferase
LANFQQYGLEDHFVSVVLADASQKTMWKTGSLFDAIITDPPYGIREKGRKLGVKEKHKPVWTNNE